MEEYIDRAAVGMIPGGMMIVLGLVYYLTLTSVAIVTIGMTRAIGEVLPRFGGDNGHEQQEEGKPKSLRAWLFPAHRRRQYLALIITDRARAVSQRILTDLRRGITALEGKGMYTGKNRSILMCAITVTEIHNLKSAVAKEDPQAFVMVTPAHEVLGRGFNPLAEE